jgi:hypothetical protein
MTAIITDIEYDLSDFDIDEQDNIRESLPKELEFSGLDCDMDEITMDEAISDFISNYTGFCHLGFNYHFKDDEDMI